MRPATPPPETERRRIPSLARSRMRQSSADTTRPQPRSRAPRAAAATPAAAWRRNAQTGACPFEPRAARPTEPARAPAPSAPNGAEKTKPSTNRPGAPHKVRSRFFPPAQLLALELDFAFEFVEQPFIPRAHLRPPGRKSAFRRKAPAPARKAARKSPARLCSHSLAAHARNVNECPLGFSAREQTLLIKPVERGHHRGVGERRVRDGG